MRVLLATGIYPPDIGGPATFVPALAAEWVKRGHSVTVVTYGDAHTQRSVDWKVDVVARSGGTFFRYLRYSWHVYRLARYVDVVFVQGPFSDGFPGTIGACLARRPTALRVPGDFAWEGMQRATADSSQSLEAFLNQSKPFPWNLIFVLEGWIARRAKRVITPSIYLQQLATAWGVFSGHMKVVYNTVELETALPAREQLREAMHFSKDTKVILWVGRLAPWKRVDLLIEVLSGLPAEYQLVVLGEGMERARLEALAEQRGVRARVRFEGRVSRHVVQEWAMTADVFLLPSLYEGFPHVAVEMACLGLPCFLSDKGGNSEAVALYTDRMKLLPYGDVSAWRKALELIPPRLPRIEPQAFSEVAKAYLDVVSSVL